ncbi:MAG: helix-turn-helix transcriptional regulator [Acidobacteria bacterium]|nr:helix-turn-helix transcriptional regulator [Acidobacteriota bacterium]
MRDVIQVLQKDLGREIPVEELARLVNLSASHLRLLFRKETGVTPDRYLKSLRIEKATELLENSFLSVKEIMLKVGVGDLSHFVRDFKTARGLTPRQYRTHFKAGEVRGGGPGARP